MNHLKLVTALGLVALLSGCYAIRLDARFVLNGMIKDSSGNARVVSADQRIKLCAVASFSKLDTDTSTTRKGEKSTVCVPLITDQYGRYLVNAGMQIRGPADQKIDLKNVKLYATIDSGDKTYLLPANITNMRNLTESGGQISADITLMDLE